MSFVRGTFYYGDISSNNLPNHSFNSTAFSASPNLYFIALISSFNSSSFPVFVSTYKSCNVSESSLYNPRVLNSGVCSIFIKEFENDDLYSFSYSISFSRFCLSRSSSLIRAVRGG